MKHVPGFIEKAEEFKAKGVSEILLISGMTFCLSIVYCFFDKFAFGFPECICEIDKYVI